MTEAEKTEAKRLQKVRELFDATAELPVAQRLAHLRGLTDDDSIVQEVLALCLANDEDSTTHFSKPLSSVLQSAAAPALKPGDTVGVWQIGREIGQGGMGSVFLVERVDGHFAQKAALKLVKGLPRSETLAFFSRERQLLANLSHPNIARLLDGGATKEGQPYLVMEYIDGVAIDQYCRERPLTIRKILELFVNACEAVAFAHRQLIVHCDLKPSNMLIDRDGRPILLDFGIARLLDEVGAQADGDAAGAASAYTPRYASPEQRARGIVSTVSDVYILGIMLGELLGNAAQREVEITAVVAKATHRDPGCRYPTVEAFVDDIRRYLRHLPVGAVPTSPAYVARKLIVRRWPVVLATVAFATMIAGFTVKVVIEGQRAAAAEKAALLERDRAQLAESEAIRERDATLRARAEAVAERDAAARDRDRATEAERTAAQQRNIAQQSERLAIAERDRARAAEAASEQTSDFLVSIFEGSNPNSEITPIPAATLLKQAEQRLDKQLQGQPATQSDIYAALAKVQTNIGNREAARAHYAKALAFERTQNRPLKLAAILFASAKLALREFGNASAEKDAREALLLREKFAGPLSELTAESLVQLGSMLSVGGKHAEAGELLARAVSIFRRTPKPSEGLIGALAQLGPHQSRIGEHEASIATLREVVGLRASMVGTKDGAYANDLQMLGRTLSAAKMYADAETVFRSAILVYKEAYGDQSQPYGWAVAELARMLSNSGKPLSAIVLFDEALPVIEKSLGANSPSYGVIVHNSAGALENAGDDINADLRYQKALSILEKLWAEFDLSPVRHAYATFLAKTGQHEVALVQIERALKARQQKLRDTHQDVLASQAVLARVLVRSGRLESGSAVLSSILSRPQATATPLAMAVAREMAIVDSLNGKMGDAIRTLERVDEFERNRYGANDFRYLASTIDRIELKVQRGNASEKSAGLAEARQLIERMRPIVVPKAPILRRLQMLLLPSTGASAD